MNEFIIKSKKEERIYDKDINVDAIPLCNGCFIEIKEGIYLCMSCKLNCCSDHINSHFLNKHKILKLNKKNLNY